MKCFNFQTFPTPVLTYNRKRFEIYCFVNQFFEVSSLTYLGQLFRNESVSSTVEKRVVELGKCSLMVSFARPPWRWQLQAGVTAALCSLGRQQLVQATPPQYTESIFTPLLIAPGPSVVLVVDRQQTELLQLHWVETDRRQLSRDSTVSFRIAFLSSQVNKNL